MKKRNFLRCLCTLLILVCAISMLSIPALAADDFPTVLAQAKQGVVQIYGLGYDRKDRPDGAWTGSGFAVGNAGEESDIFLTNNHVVTCSSEYDLDHVRVWILLEDCEIDSRTRRPDPDKSLECKVIYTPEDGYPDFAIIKVIDGRSKFKALPLLSSKDVPVGTKVYALGFPGVVDAHSATTSGQDSITVTDGIASKHMEMTDAEDTWVIMHTAQISGGNSGGPLITSEGAVVGLNTYGFSRNLAEYYCAVYIDYAMDALDDEGIHYDVYGQEEETEPTETTEEDKGLDDKTIMIIGGSVGGAVVLALLAWLLLRKRKQKATAHGAVRPIGGTGKPNGGAQFMVRMPDGSVIPLNPGSNFVGRNPDCTVRFPADASAVSRRHCVLEVADGSLYLMDQGSVNGTFIRGSKLTPYTRVPLSHGQEFCVGSENNILKVC